MSSLLVSIMQAQHLQPNTLQVQAQARLNPNFEVLVIYL